MIYKKQHYLSLIKKVDIKTNLHRPASSGWHLVSQISPEQSSSPNSENSTNCLKDARKKSTFFKHTEKISKPLENIGFGTVSTCAF